MDILKLKSNKIALQCIKFVVYYKSNFDMKERRLYLSHPIANSDGLNAN